jgi:polyisoprenoid-binding protein YceI
MKLSTSLSTIFLATLSLFVSGCVNPADKTEDARVSDAVDAVESIASARTYSISGDSTISFVGSKVTGSHEGGFKEFSGTIEVADGKIAPASKITIQMDSLWSDNDRLTGHLKNADFFDVPTFPTAEFVVTSMNDSGELTGNLTMHGVTKSITFPSDVEIAGSSVSLKAEFDIKRFDWGIVYKGKADDLIRDEVVIKLDVTASGDA